MRPRRLFRSPMTSPNVFFRRDHFNRHNRLHDQRLRFARGLAKRHPSGNLKGKLVGVDVVVFAVVEPRPDAFDGIAGKRPLFEGALNAFLHRRDKLARDVTAFDLVDELEAGAVFGRAELRRRFRQTGRDRPTAFCACSARQRTSGWLRGRPPAACLRWLPP